ncbi:MAG TPA: serine hydrolase [Chlamydiales bacterium]|jgi:CubicO group peptidase (beta-lactamase class C family)
MLKRFLAFLVLAIPVLGYASFFSWSEPLSPRAQKAQELLVGIDEAFEKALKDFNVPGMALGVVVDGQVVLVKGYGCRDLEHCSPVTEETVFPIGSCTKSFTTFVMGILNEQDRLSWDQLVIDVLPEFRLNDEYATRHATFRDLVTHRTGLSRHDFMFYNSAHSSQELTRRIRYLDPICAFRERYNYNNLAYMVAGLAVEQVSGKTWGQFIEKNVFEPLQMHSTSTSIQDLQRKSNIAYPYVEKKGILKRMPFRDFSNVAPTASINSNVVDLAHWLQMLLNKGTYRGTQLISPTTLQEMQSAQIVSAGYPETNELLINTYGLGWDILSYRGRYCVGHDGGVDGFTSALWMLPNEGIGVVILTNRNLNGIPRMAAYEVFDRLLGLPFRNFWLEYGLEKVERTKKEQEAKQSVERMRKPEAAPLHPLQHYTGVYEHPGYGMLTVEEKEGMLHATLNGITYVLDHWQYDAFEIVDELQDLLFSRQGEKFSFRHNLYREIDEVRVPFDSGTPDVVFKRKSTEYNVAYFRQFTGSYSYYNLSIDVSIRNRSLFAIMPGQPLYELLPFSENEFQVKGKPGYVLRFVKKANGEIAEALLVPPYGGSFSARKV